jgi:hypothetical protein
MPCARKAEAHRIDGVVRNGEAVDLDIADAKRGPGLETIQARRVFAPGNGGRGEAGDEDRHIEQARQSHQAADVIGMLVRDQDRVQLFGSSSISGEPGENVALAEAGVDQDARFFGADEGGVSRAAAGENADLDYDGLRCSASAWPRSLAACERLYPRGPNAGTRHARVRVTQALRDHAGCCVHRRSSSPNTCAARLPSFCRRRCRGR